MAYPTPVNDQITDSVTQSNVQVLASSPATAMGAINAGNQQLTRTSVAERCLESAKCKCVINSSNHQLCG